MAKAYGLRFGLKNGNCKIGQNAYTCEIAKYTSNEVETSCNGSGQVFRGCVRCH
jgi:hypothetical protein